MVGVGSLGDGGCTVVVGLVGEGTFVVMLAGSADGVFCVVMLLAVCFGLWVLVELCVVIDAFGMFLCCTSFLITHRILLLFSDSRVFTVTCANLTRL